MLAALLYAIGPGRTAYIKSGGRASGSGKTMLCRKLAAQLPTASTALSRQPHLVARRHAGGDPRRPRIDAPESGRQARLAQLNALTDAHEAGRRVVVFVEEAQGIALDNLEFLRLLTNLETATDKLLQIVLFVARTRVQLANRASVS